jgi:hypothetical protein
MDNILLHTEDTATSLFPKDFVTSCSIFFNYGKTRSVFVPCANILPLADFEEVNNVRVELYLS